MKLEDQVGVRVTGELRARFLRLLEQPQHRGRKEADLLRIAWEDWCTAHEKDLKLPPITQEQVEHYLDLLMEERSGAGGKKAKAPAPPKKVKYVLRRRRGSPSAKNFDN